MLAMKSANVHQRPPNGLTNNATSAAFNQNAPVPLNGLSSNGGGRATSSAAEGRSRLTELPAGLLSEQELEGGQLINVEEREEIDPEDGCKIQIWTYHILSADGMEESTITSRRKLKVNCTQSLKRVEFTNGRETKYEERAIMNNLDSLGENPMLSGRAALFGGPSIEAGANGQQQQELMNGDGEDEDSKEISNMLLRTQDNFLLLLREKKDALVKMFPELFSNLRTLPAIFELMPSTVQETIVNEDGSTTTRTKCSKAFSSHYTRQETFINGVRKECKTGFRAFMEYAGPEGGFCIRLNDNPEADLSEDEGIELEDGQQQQPKTRISLAAAAAPSMDRSGISEIADSQSALVTTGRQGQLCLVEGKEATKRWEKAWHAVNEMVESEERYVQKLALLNKFRTTVETARVLDRRQMSLLFANIASLHQFHEQHLLPQLMDRRREWQSTRRINDVLRKQAPFLKMYSEYTNNYKLATQMFEESARRRRQFDEIVKQIEHMPECEHLSLVSHLICPVQRVMRYQLLLKEYQKHLGPQDPDWQDTEAALSLVLEAASHANEMMRKLDRYRNVLEVQEQLGNLVSLVSPGRELLTRARLSKCSSSTGKEEERVLFVFNDLFLLASERTALIGGAKYKLRALFSAKHTQICEGDNLELENSFYLRGADSEQGPQRCVELFSGSQAEKNALFDTVWAVIQEAHSQEPGAHSAAAPKNGTTMADHQRPNNCARCDTDFGWYTRQYACLRCSQRFCKRCIKQKPQRMCLDCSRTAEGIRSKSEGISSLMGTAAKGGGAAAGTSKQPRRNLLQVKASSSAGDDDAIIKASYINFRGPSGKPNNRFFVLRKDFCLYSYRTDQDTCALAMLPLSGCDVGVHQQQPDKFGISLKHMNRSYVLTCFSEMDHAEWLAALLLSANAQLPGERATNGSNGQAAAAGEINGDGGPAGLRKSATIGFSAGRNNSIHPQQPQQQNGSNQKAQRSGASLLLNPLASLIRRSASMGEERLGSQPDLAVAREKVRELNARNADIHHQQNQREKSDEGNTADNEEEEDGRTFRF